MCFIFCEQEHLAFVVWNDMPKIFSPEYLCRPYTPLDQAAIALPTRRKGYASFVLMSPFAVLPLRFTTNSTC
jgi:hypothetical protein